MSTLLGTTLSGRYRLDERIAAGGMSTVYKATDEKLERFVAIKVMNQEIAADSEQLERFSREARAVAQLSHVNIVGVIDAGDDGGHPYIVFEYVPGETLKEAIHRIGPLPIPEAVAYAIEIARALGVAHAHHIVHRDVKPQNVLIDAESGVAKVTDFGIARTLEEEGLTSDGRVIGTTDYVSPEQALGHPVTGQSDLYSLGIVLYEMLTGELPFQGEGQVAVAMKHVRAQMPDVRAARPGVSATLAAIVEKATAKDTSHRYATDRELISDLEDVLALETSRAGESTGQATSVLRSLPPGKRSRVPLTVRARRGTVITMAILSVLVIAVVVLLVVRTERGSGGNGPQPRRSTSLNIPLTAATAYNPDGIGGTEQNNAEADLAVDGNDKTAWTTETYYSGSLDKAGVGIYVTAKTAQVARRLTLLTTTPGFNVTIYGSSAVPNPNTLTSSWMPLASANGVTASDSLVLASGQHKYKYYLVWITQLPDGQKSAAINEVRIFS